MSVTDLKMLAKVILFGDTCAPAFRYMRCRVSDTLRGLSEFLLIAA